MDDLRIGRAFRRVRIQRGWTQAQAAAQAKIGRGVYSRIERGLLDGITIGALRTVAAKLEVRLALEARWRGGELDRVLSTRHSTMAEIVGRRLIDAGWEIRPEVSFNHFGERGIVDLVAWHETRGIALLVELKTELIDVGEVLGTMDRRRRLGFVIAASCGWQPTAIAAWLVIADGRTNRRRVATFRTALRAAFPEDGRSVAGWLAEPTRPAAALWFLPSDRVASGGRGLSPVKRVHATARRPAGPSQLAS
jgi:transcriptional regulator with XRE-family HTH domain